MKYTLSGGYLVQRPRTVYPLVTGANPRITVAYASPEEAVQALLRKSKWGIGGAVIYEMRPVLKVKRVVRGAYKQYHLIPLSEDGLTVARRISVLLPNAHVAPERLVL